MQKFENFYLQTKGELSWETLDESQNLDNLVARLEEKNTSLSGLKIRIIGAFFDEDNNSWKYEQLFSDLKQNIGESLERVRGSSFYLKQNKGQHY